MNIDIRRPIDGDHYSVNGFDISDAFHQFQCAVETTLKENGSLHQESHVHHILALSSIFLVKPLQFHDDIKRYIPNEMLHEMVNDLRIRYNINESKKPLDLLAKILPLLDVRDMRSIVSKIVQFFFFRISGVDASIKTKQHLSFSF